MSPTLTIAPFGSTVGGTCLTQSLPARIRISWHTFHTSRRHYPQKSSCPSVAKHKSTGGARFVVPGIAHRISTPANSHFIAIVFPSGNAPESVPGRISNRFGHNEACPSELPGRSISSSVTSPIPSPVHPQILGWTQIPASIHQYPICVHRRNPRIPFSEMTERNSSQATGKPQLPPSRLRGFARNIHALARYFKDGFTRSHEDTKN